MDNDHELPHQNYYIRICYFIYSPFLALSHPFLTSFHLSSPLLTFPLPFSLLLTFLPHLSSLSYSFITLSHLFSLFLTPFTPFLTPFSPLLTLSHLFSQSAPSSELVVTLAFEVVVLLVEGWASAIPSGPPPRRGLGGTCAL